MNMISTIKRKDIGQVGVISILGTAVGDLSGIVDKELVVIVEWLEGIDNEVVSVVGMCSDCLCFVLSGILLWPQTIIRTPNSSFLRRKCM